jgi:hypothetical protein
VAQEAVGGVQVHALRSPHWLVAVVLHEARCCPRCEGVPPPLPENRSAYREVEVSNTMRSDEQIRAGAQAVAARNTDGSRVVDWQARRLATDALALLVERDAALARAVAAETAASFAVDAAFLERMLAFSLKTFGPGERLAAHLSHLREELDEVDDNPTDPFEWADVIILAAGGAMRQGIEPQALLDAVGAKLAKNEARTWPDWRTVPDGRHINHVRAGAAPEGDPPPKTPGELLREVDAELARGRAAVVQATPEQDTQR